MAVDISIIRSTVFCIIPLEVISSLNEWLLENIVGFLLLYRLLMMSNTCSCNQLSSPFFCKASVPKSSMNKKSISPIRLIINSASVLFLPQVDLISFDISKKLVKRHCLYWFISSLQMQAVKCVLPVPELPYMYIPYPFLSDKSATSQYFLHRSRAFKMAMQRMKQKN